MASDSPRETPAHHENGSHWRWPVYYLLILLALGQMTGRLLAVNSVDKAGLENYRINARLADFRAELKSQPFSDEEIAQKLQAKRTELGDKLRLQRPFLSGNDRSRWMAIRSLVEHGTYAIDKVFEEPTWDTIDMVQHEGRDGELYLYSSKPPLLITLIAGEYWLIHKLTGATLGTHPYSIGRGMLFTINILPMGLMLLLVAGVCERLFNRISTGDDYQAEHHHWARIFVVATACFGTLLLPFAVVLNNHLVAAVSASVALYAWARVRLSGDSQIRWFVLAGLSAGFTAANELPALAFVVLLGCALLIWSPKGTIFGYLPAALVVAAAFFGTNYAAHDTWKPPYAHRSTDDPKENWYEFTYTAGGQERQSYWSNPQGIDRGEPSEATYALHCLVGHHGLFSLTPVWLLSFAGMVAWVFRGGIAITWSARRELAMLVLALSLIVLSFYLFGVRLPRDRNYGGMTSGLRWMFWFTPLWLATMVPAAAWLGQRSWGRWLAGLLLAMSALSAAYPTWNPWQQPWIYNWLVSIGWSGF